MHLLRAISERVVLDEQDCLHGMLQECFHVAVAVSHHHAVMPGQGAGGGGGSHPPQHSSPPTPGGNTPGQAATPPVVYHPPPGGSGSGPPQPPLVLVPHSGANTPPHLLPHSSMVPPQLATAHFVHHQGESYRRDNHRMSHLVTWASIN